nr:peptidylprolyl isomerase [Armatimonas sp.]
MSLMGMKQHIQKFSLPIVAFIGISMLGTSVYSGLGRNSGNARARSEAKAEATVAQVGSQAVTQRMLDRIMEPQLQQFKMFGMPPPPAEALDSYRLRALDGIKSQEALVVAAKKAGITITDEEMKKGTDEVWETQVRSRIAQQLTLSEKATDKEINDTLAKQGANISVESLKEQLILPDSLRIKLFNDKLTKQQAEKLVALDTYKVRHILINWDGKKTTEAAAKAKAEKLLADVKATPTKFAELATANSEDPGSKDKGGLYEWKKEELTSLVPEFKAAIATLKPGETTPALVRHADPDPKGYKGFHIIHLDAISKATQEKREELARAEITKLVDAAAPGIKVEVQDPGMRAMQLFQDASKDPAKPDEKLLNQAIAELDKIKKEDDRAGIVPLRKAAILEKLKQPAKAIAALEDAIQSNGDKVETRIRITTLLIAKGDKAGAIKQLAEAEKLALPEPGIWGQLGQLYKQAGDTAGERRTLEKNQAYTLRQQQLQAQEQALAAKNAPQNTNIPGKNTNAPGKK